MLTYSVITACRNSARTIGRTIESVYRQNRLPDEYLFVDGGSTDETRDVVARATAGHPGRRNEVRARVIEQEGRGITAAWNIGLRQCSSDVVFILNSDDWYDDDTAAKVLTVFEQRPEVEIVVGEMRTYRRGSTAMVGVHRNRPRWLLPVLMPFIHPACFVRRQVYGRLGGFDAQFNYVADYEFMYRCVKNDVEIEYLKEPVVNFELGGAADSHRREVRWEMRRVAQQHRAFPPVPWFAYLIRTALNR